MKHFFYPRLALTNLKKNAKLYIPYLLTSMFTVTMFYIIHSLSSNTHFINDPQSSGTLLLVLQLGTWIVVIFSVIFLFYINSFLMKRRKKEVALYNILGMEKKHVMIMMFCETIFTTFISIVGGIILGLLLSKLVFLCLVNLIHISTTMAFEISVPSIMMTIFIFVPIYIAAYLFNVFQIKIANPIELLRGSQTGEKEPKTKWLMTIVGLVCLGAGYYIAQTTESPMVAIMLFFVAVILVVIGTYCLFTAGSVTILKALKKNKTFYYKTNHFTAVSQMIYRMKQNAVGLASICILYTCILVMLSSTVSLYVSIQDSAQLALDEHMKITFDYNDDGDIKKQEKELNQYVQKIQTSFIKHGIETTTFLARNGYSEYMRTEGNKVYSHQANNLGGSLYTGIIAMNSEDYNTSYQKDVVLKENEVLVKEGFMNLKDTIVINDKTFQIKGTVKESYFLPTNQQDYAQWLGVVFNNEETLQKVMKIKEDSLKRSLELSIDFKDHAQSDKAYQLVDELINLNMGNGNTSSGHYVNIQSQYEIEKMFTEMYGSLFFLGIFLGSIFLVAAILIMYYKQLSEGYEDQKRFEIMQNVGMNTKEVKQSIRSQVLIFFFLPLAVSILHMIFAFNLIVSLFGFLVLSGESVFIMCTAIAIGVLIAIYSIVYVLTSRTYYRIVKQ